MWMARMAAMIQDLDRRTGGQLRRRYVALFGEQSRSSHRPPPHQEDVEAIVKQHVA